ncbi:MAG: DUF1648 domain-containing protein [Vicingaceae bacterium]
MKRPRVKIPLSNIDWLIEIVGGVFFILMIVYPWHYFDQLPETIPTHFDASGNPDGYDSKDKLWNILSIGGVIYIVLTILNFSPHFFNYLTTITEENAARQYRLATTLLRRLKVLIAICFFEIAYGTIQIALFNSESLNAWFLPAFLIMNLVILVDYFYSAFKK